MTQKVQVDYPEVNSSDLHGAGDKFVIAAESFPYEFSIDKILESEFPINVALNKIWREFNHVDGTEYVQELECRSSMIGDVYTLFQGSLVIRDRFFIVDGLGFLEVTESGKNKWLATGVVDRGFTGVNRMVFSGGEIVGKP